jgi:hypothetical protein
MNVNAAKTNEQIQAEVTSILNLRRQAEQRQEREEIEKALLEKDAKETARLQAIEARAEAAQAAMFNKMVARVTVEHFDRRFVINLAHPDNVTRLIACEAVNRLNRFIVRSVQHAGTLAENIGRAGGTVPTTATDPQWVEMVWSR